MHMAAALAGCRKALVHRELPCTWQLPWLAVEKPSFTASCVHMAAALAGCRKALVGTGLAISLLFDTNGCR